RVDALELDLGDRREGGIVARIARNDLTPPAPEVGGQDLAFPTEGSPEEPGRLGQVGDPVGGVIQVLDGVGHRRSLLALSGASSWRSIIGNRPQSKRMVQWKCSGREGRSRREPAFPPATVGSPAADAGSGWPRRSRG